MLTPVTITGTFTNADGSAPSGALNFDLKDSEGNPGGMTDSSTGRTVLPQTIVGIVNNGQLLALPVGGGPYTPLTLLANDDVDTEPVGGYYMVTEQLSSGGVGPWPFTVHHSAGSIDVSSQRPLPD